MKPLSNAALTSVTPIKDIQHAQEHNIALARQRNLGFSKRNVSLEIAYKIGTIILISRLTNSIDCV